MADVSPAFVAAWRSRRHVGANTPKMWGIVRKGKFVRAYQPFIMLDGSDPGDFATIPTGHSQPWNAQWTPLGPWKDLPAVQHVGLQQGFDNNGFTTATIDITNVIWGQFAGVGGNLFHKLLRGVLSPFRGFVFPGRPTNEWWMSDVNEWHDILDAAQIEIHQGYGTESTKVFTGLVDDIDMTSNPDVITITATDFGAQALGQQRVFGWAKDPKLRGPVTFADRGHADNETQVGGAAKASTEDPQHRAGEVLRGDKSRAWLSRGHDGADVTEWVEIHLPKGRYERFLNQPEYNGFEMYLSVFVTDIQPPKKGKPRKKAKVDGVETDGGWWFPPGTTPNMVPGANGGFPYIRKWDKVDNNLRKGSLLHTFEVGDNTIIRISLRNLHYHPATKKWVAGMKQLKGIALKQKSEVKKNQWILVDDAADVVRTVLRWAGFREWEVEDFGVSLKEPMVFHQSDFFIDVINHMKDQGNFLFFMGDPTADDLSIGVPKFRMQRALLPPGPNLTEVRDEDLLSGISAKLSKSPKATIIRVRGAPDKKGTALTGGEDQTKRVNATYSPPWRPKMSELDKQFIHNDPLVKTPKEAQMMAVMIACQMALAAATGSIEIPGFPALELDEQLSVVDQGTSINTRLWIASRSSDFTKESAQGTVWQTTLEGSLIDTPDILALAGDYLRALAMKDAPNTNTHPGATGGKKFPTATG